MGTVAIFGGTFNPLHTGHVQIIKSLCELDFIDKVILIPTKIPPHKETDFLAGAKHRLNFCNIISNKFLKATVSDIELNREGKSYSVDTVLNLKKLYPNQKIAITIGADMLINFKKWFKYETILENADIITFFRADSNKSDYEDAITELKELGANIICINDAIDNISSTKIRELLKEGKSVSLYLDPDIKNYIIENQVYGEI